jgi:hypothetical protein
MNTSKVAVIANAAFGKITSIIGYCVGGFSLIALSTVFFIEMDAETTIGMVFFLFLLAFSVLCVVKGAQIKRRIKRFKKYIALISGQQMTSLENIAASTSQSVNFVYDDLQKMINKKFFANAVIDKEANEIIIGGKKTAAPAPVQTQTTAPSELEAYICPGCEASGSKPKGIRVSCEYCGTEV